MRKWIPGNSRGYGRNYRILFERLEGIIRDWGAVSKDRVRLIVELTQSKYKNSIFASPAGEKQNDFC